MEEQRPVVEQADARIAAMPVIVADLGGFGRYTWVSTAYVVMSTVTVPILGRLSDIYGRRIFAILGTIILIIGAGPPSQA